MIGKTSKKEIYRGLLILFIVICFAVYQYVEKSNNVFPFLFLGASSGLFCGLIFFVIYKIINKGKNLTSGAFAADEVIVNSRFVDDSLFEVEVVKALEEKGRKITEVEFINQTLEIKTKPNMKTYGEIIRIKFSTNSNEMSADIRSELKSKLSNFDWGQNHENVEIIKSYLS